MTVRLANPTSNAISTLTIHEVKLTNWTYQLPEDDFVLENAAFSALYITTEDA